MTLEGASKFGQYQERLNKDLLALDKYSDNDKVLISYPNNPGFTDERNVGEWRSQIREALNKIEDGSANEKELDDISYGHEGGWIVVADSLQPDYNKEKAIQDYKTSLDKNPHEGEEIPYMETE